MGDCRVIFGDLGVLFGAQEEMEDEEGVRVGGGGSRLPLAGEGCFVSKVLANPLLYVSLCLVWLLPRLLSCSSISRMPKTDDRRDAIAGGILRSSAGHGRVRGRLPAKPGNRLRVPHDFLQHGPNQAGAKAGSSGTGVTVRRYSTISGAQTDEVVMVAMGKKERNKGRSRLFVVVGGLGFLFWCTVVFRLFSPLPFNPPLLPGKSTVPWTLSRQAKEPVRQSRTLPWQHRMCSRPSRCHRHSRRTRSPAG